MARQRGGGSSAKSGGIMGTKAAPAPARVERTPPPPVQAKASPAPSVAAPVRSTPPPPSSAPTHHAPAPAPAPHSFSAPPPATNSYSPAPAPAAPSGGMFSGIGGMVVQGMAMGTGSAIAHQAINGIVGSFSGGKEEQKAPAAAPQAQAPAQGAYQVSKGPCMYSEEEFQKCMKEQNGSVGQCQYFYDALKQCQTNNPQHY